MSRRAAAEDGELAVHLATAAGRVLLALREETGFGDPAALRALGDRRSHEYLSAELKRHRPDDAVLSEEGADDARRLTSPRVWIIDPLDGTREYAERGRTDWAVHVALWQRGELVAGAVAVPARNLVLSTTGARLGERGAAETGPLRLAVSRTRAPALVQRLATALNAELVPMGSAGVKIGAVVLGEVDAYVHGGGQYEWDSAAPVAVARSARCHASRLDGRPLVYNQRDAWLPDLVVCRPELRDRLLAALSAIATAERTS
ncbi:3'(2'),5'-bisphosphate nucleotidase CysQ [Streptomyces sp. SID7499]|uniref:3'(2'),5'-bisphosphate nucleotidase CysQ n=1 Tax=Streptomyces sp. SID7499 TaxID=2706086 RepID=A0A6G3X8P0_9ACTN|nr:3'(2'),5'-bisphosphate nucleotidase CysQ [Streptomyces sp. SID7499]